MEQEYFSRVVAYRRRSPDSSVRLCALHGALRSARDMFVLSEILPEVDFTTLDLPGHGLAPHSLTGYSPESLADAIWEVFEPDDDPRPIIFLGESFSGLTALTLATIDHRIRSVVLIDTPFETSRMVASHKVLLHTWHTQSARKDMIEGISHDFFGLNLSNRSVTQRTYWHYVTSCPVPVTLITGTLKVDSELGAGAFFCKRDVDALFGTLRLKVIEIEGAGHSVLRVKPLSVSEVLRELL